MDFSLFDSDATISEFLDEARGNMATVNRRLLEAERGTLSTEALHEMFRGAHSLKGLAGMFNLTQICEMTHALETVFDMIRKGKLDCSSIVIQVAFDAVDVIGALLDDVAQRREQRRDIGTTILHLKKLVPGAEPSSPKTQPSWKNLPPNILPVLHDIDLSTLTDDIHDKKIWLLRIPIRELLARQRDLVQVWIEFERLFDIRAIQVLMQQDDISAFDALDHFQWHLGMIVLTKEDIHEALASLLLPRHDGWCLDVATHSAVRQVFLPVPASLPTGEVLEVKPEMHKHLTTWLAESREELESLDAALLGLERESQGTQGQRSAPPTGDPSTATLGKICVGTQTLQEAFRLAHRIKGSAATMGLHPIASIAHNLEWALDLLRSDRLTPNSQAVEALLAIKDWISNAVGHVERADLLIPDLAPIESALLVLSDRAAPPQATIRVVRRQHFTASQIALAQSQMKSDEKIYQASVELRHDCHLPDLRCLLAISQVAKIAVVAASIPSREDLDQGKMPGSVLHLLLRSRFDEDALRDCLCVDEILRCDVCVLDQMCTATQALPQQSSLAPMLKCAQESAVLVHETQEQPTPNTTALVGKTPISLIPEQLVTEGKPAVQVPEHATPVVGSIRVDAHRLDHLMNVAGELVVAKVRITMITERLSQAMKVPTATDLSTCFEILANAPQGLGNERLERLRRWLAAQTVAQDLLGELSETVVGLHRSTGALQTNAMQMRMVPVAPLFQRFHRVIRDLCRSLGKQAHLTMHGEGTELDKKLTDDLVDPLTHLVRNALDHGLESSDERRKQGKPDSGTVTLSAFQEGGQICISIQDDGRGIDPTRLKIKAVEKGLISQTQADVMDDDAARNLIFLPGFSTAAQVSNVSGRGVGMDIVRSKIAELKGSIAITSTVGVGTTLTIRLPLTLAMIKALLVRIGGERFALPLDAVREIVEIEHRLVRQIDSGTFVIPLRDRFIPLADLPSTIDLHQHEQTGNTLRAVITKGCREPMVIPVDAVLREEEIVVKPLPEEFAGVRGLAGASILGDGGVVLILDVPSAVRRPGGVSSHA